MYLFPLQCQHILKLTSVMMLPENFATAEPVKLMTVILQPREDTGLVGLSIVTGYTQNDKDVSLSSGHFLPENQTGFFTH